MPSLSLVPVVQELWKAWEIHFLILVSLFLQVFLFLFGGMRRHSSNWFLRTVLWLAYLSADSVAVFVLGHLAVRAREPGHELVAFWAPFVLVHLGGQDTITAFSKQDNELWLRHLLNLVFQVAVAGYVVAKASWPDARLRAAMVIMFVCGCIKYAERVFCLFRADTKSLKGYVEDARVVGRRSRERTMMEEATKDMSDRLDMMSKGCSSGPPSVLFWDIRATIIDDIISVDAPLNKAQSITVAAHGDLLPGMLNSFLSSKSRHSAYEYVGALLEYCYRRLYTKDFVRLAVFPPRRLPYLSRRSRILKTCLYILSMTCFLHFILLSTIAASVALTLFMAVHKRDQLHTSNRVDITVTYALLVGAIVLDVSSAASFIFLHLSFYLPCLAKPIQSVLTCCTKQQWSQELGQYNIIICRNAAFTRQATWFGLDYNVLKSKPVTKDHTYIKKFILDTLLSSGTRKEWNIASTRGKLALQKWMDCHKQDDNQQTAHHDLATTTFKSLEEIITSSADFPTSVLILHIATDICYHYGDGGTNSDHQAVKKHKQTSTELSNYIMYLVFKCGVMLTTNSQIVHNFARDDILGVLPRDSQSRLWYNLLFGPGDHKDDTLKLFDEIKKQQQESMAEIQVMHQESEEQQDAPTETKTEESADNDDNAAHHIKELQKNSQTLKSPVLPRAVAVAQEFMSINDEAERWKLIAAVWAEMLFYIAPRCGGAFHYEYLSRGGEFVTHVLLLMYHLGPFLPPRS
jgi:hypothetical protein